MRFAFGFRDFDQVFCGETRGFRQDGPGDGDLVVPCKAANDGRRCLGNGSQLNADFGKRQTGADIRDRPKLDRVDQTFEQIVEQLDMLRTETAGGGQKQIGNVLDRCQALFRRSDIDDGFDFVDDG